MLEVKFILENKIVSEVLSCMTKLCNKCNLKIYNSKLISNFVELFVFSNASSILLLKINIF